MSRRNRTVYEARSRLRFGSALQIVLVACYLFVRAASHICVCPSGRQRLKTHRLLLESAKAASEPRASYETGKGLRTDAQ